MSQGERNVKLLATSNDVLLFFFIKLNLTKECTQYATFLLRPDIKRSVSSAVSIRRPSACQIFP